MANKDYASISLQPSGSFTKVRAEQIKSEDGFNSLAIDLEALRGQVKDILGAADYKEDIIASYGNVQLGDLAQHIDASAVGAARTMVVKKNLQVALSASIVGDLTVDGAAQFNSLTSTAGALVFHNASKVIIDNPGLKYDAVGSALVAPQFQGSNLTATRIPFADANKNLVDNSGLVWDGSDLIAASAKVSDLTSGRVVYAGAGGALVDNTGLVFDGTDLVMASAKVSDLTATRVVYAGASGALVDSAEMTFGAGGLTLAKDLVARSGSFSGDLTIDGNLNVMGATTTVDTQNLLVKDAKIVISSGGLVDGAGIYLADDSAGENIRWATADGGKWIASDKFAADTMQALDLSEAIVYADASGNLVEVTAAQFAGYMAAGFGIDAVTTGTIDATEYTAGTGMHKSGFQFYIGQAVETTSQVQFAGVTAYLTGSGLTDGKLLKNANGLVVDASITDYIAEGTGVHKSLAGDVLTLSIGQAVETTSAVTFANITDSGLSASRLMASDASKKLVSVDLMNWVAGTANQVIVSDDADGSVTLSLPQSIDTAATVEFGKVWLDGHGANDAYIDGGSQYLELGFKGGSIPVAQSGQVALSGFTATSIIGALNELAAGSAGGKGKWVYSHSGAAAASHTFTSGEFLGSASAVAPALSAYTDVYLNGQLMVNGSDYSVSGAAVTLTFNMQAGDVLVAIIR